MFLYRREPRARSPKKGIAYDFTVDGPLTDTAHCLERTDTLTSPV